MDLNHIYGPMAPADRHGVYDFERAHPPTSLQTLDHNSGPLLKAYLDSIAAGLAFPRFVHQSAVVLWVIGQKEQVRYATEELIDEATGNFFAMKVRDDYVKIPTGKVKLGHPSLLTGNNRHARIGGEIVWNLKASHWEINNFSGRYGMRKHQKEEHLIAAAGLFAKYGIQLHVDFR